MTSNTLAFCLPRSHHNRRDATNALAVLGTAAEYHVSEAADRNAGMVLKIS
jgi:hypothetical protein